MDEIEKKKIFFKVLKWLNLIFGVYFFIISVQQLIIYKNIEIILLVPYTLILLNAIILIPYVCVIIIKKINEIRFGLNFNNEYIRDLNKEYPPAIMSLLYDLKNETYRDYTATILYLYTKKYINISKFNEDVAINAGINKNFDNLMKHERYARNCLINYLKFDESKFKDYIISDAVQKGLVEIKDNKNQKDIKLMDWRFFILFIIYICLLLMIKNNIILKIIEIMLVIIISLLFLANLLKKFNNKAKYKLTSKGKKELKKIKAFKNFINDYTLIEEKDIEHVEILGEYIPYSLSLGMSPQVEEYIKKNEIYRYLIYKGREK